MANPLKLNPVPLTAAWEIVTLVPPVLVTVSEAVCWVPTVTLPKAWLDGLAVICPAETPVPESGIVSVGFEPFDVSVTLPLPEPVACGAKITLKVVLCPAASVVGMANPLKLNPEPLTAAWEIVRLVPPVLVTVSETDSWLPTVTLPKASLVGLLERCPGAMPVPVSEIVSVELGALEVNVTFPDTAPAV